MATEVAGFDSTRTLALTAIERWQRSFIANPVYDAVFFMFSPLLGLGLAFVVARPVGPHGQVAMLYWGGPVWTVWTYAHLCAVVFRSHLNPAIFSRHRGRFIAVPLVLYAGMLSSMWVFTIGLVLAVYWDVYHTSAQNFGFCRIYDAKQGNAPEQGRDLDFWLNHVIYIGPILGGLNLVPHLMALNRFKRVGVDQVTFITSILRFLPLITLVVVVGGLTFIGFYLYSYWRLSQQGYRVSPQKICLLVSTAAASILAWGFLPPVRAFFVANFPCASVLRDRVVDRKDEHPPGVWARADRLRPAARPARLRDLGRSHGDRVQARRRADDERPVGRDYGRDLADALLVRRLRVVGAPA
ncbi:MAG TPA: hypothetical protein VKM54_20340 [Myxococcota bacterium]|nr:hypothetical protein [Myxococcota bacterium]